MSNYGQMKLSRRSILKAAGYGVAGMAVGVPSLLSAQVPASGFDKGTIDKSAVQFQSETGGKSPTPAPWSPEKKIGFAIVALGRLSLQELLPAFGQCHYAKLTALVSGTQEKLKLTAKQYGIPDSHLYNYDDFDKIADNKDVDVVFIVLPNSMHREFTERAAKAGKHVLCEKPLASTTDDARAMVDACRKANVKLMTAYRCQYEPLNRAMIELARGSKLGKLRFIEATNTQTQGSPDQWRLKKAMSGGGSLPNHGLYCLNAARYISGEEPVEVFASIVTDKSDPRFREVEDRVSWQMRFPSGVIASCNTSYDAYDSKDLAIRSENGWAKLEGAFAYRGKRLWLARKDESGKKNEELKLNENNQFAAEIDHFAQCVRNDVVPHTPGEEGLQDHIIMDAIYHSADKREPVSLPEIKGLDTTRGPKPQA